MSINNALDNLPDMAVFARVVDAGSFSGAARELGVTPSAVSRQVARLEGVLRVRLLERTTRKLRLTEAGSAAYTRCQAMVAAAREVLALSDTNTATPRGLVRISMPKAFGRLVVHPLMARFLAQYPEVDVQLVITDRTVDLFEEAIDLAIRITDAPPPGLAGRPLMRIAHLTCASPRYLAEHGSPLHPRDLAQHSCLYLGEDERDRHWRFRRAGAEVTVKVRGRYVANHSEVRLEGALNHLGIASLPEFTARAALAAGELVTVLDDWEHATDYAGMAWLLYPPNRFLPAKLRVWIDHLVAGLAGLAMGRE
ncbi:MAG: LysR family transcriptional regulator [Polaromonas sp.]|jgi:DNA-binding transcriptional LysR family regulator|uniref:LysR family transcriptional regulator n=1 Tax=Polaromonas sp. TaxID=1869339 RepID=UPI0027303F54|nr:LysR family transcriptional regulator [Polaromonas sp.]MDP2257002.1 LysR family transcriptional regulator [Polaromonas sp.]